MQPLPFIGVKSQRSNPYQMKNEFVKRWPSRGASRGGQAEEAEQRCEQRPSKGGAEGRRDGAVKADLFFRRRLRPRRQRTLEMARRRRSSLGFRCREKKKWSL
ncbi:unnamed protein product [Linum trigynum]|uniref:Uncharacterized protein n=1 Tax=Linum trigynum TaxID=586398 RepID=A0AAV2GYI0_9ROSI